MSGVLGKVDLKIPTVGLVIHWEESGVASGIIVSLKWKQTWSDKS
jgi:hypothetical protein